MPRPGDWLCPNCQVWIFHNKPFCLKCNISKACTTRIFNQEYQQHDFHFMKGLHDLYRRQRELIKQKAIKREPYLADTCRCGIRRIDCWKHN